MMMMNDTCIQQNMMMKKIVLASVSCRGDVSAENAQSHTSSKICTGLKETVIRNNDRDLKNEKLIQ